VQGLFLKFNLKIRDHLISERKKYGKRRQKNEARENLAWNEWQNAPEKEKVEKNCRAKTCKDAQ
jgi:hypothetical protein